MSKATTQHRKAFDAYYNSLTSIHAQGATHELATRQAFSVLLETLARVHGWTLVMEQALPSGKRPDGTLFDKFNLPRGHWEAKDTADDLKAEIERKIKSGYPLTNIIFEDTQRAVLYQNGSISFEADLHDRSQLAELFEQLFAYTEPHVEQFDEAVEVFEERIPELAGALEKTIEDERKTNRKFIAAFEAFHNICKGAIDPNISADEIEKMLVQHLLTERLFRTIFDNPDFVNRNAIAAEIEKVIHALTSRSFSRAEFLKRLDHFYNAIENAAETIDDFAQKQTFLNTVYERFFQGYSRAQADTHGIVYTPQPIVDFMRASVEAVLQREFGKSLSDEGVLILDPCTGTGNFVVNIMRHLRRRDLPRKYARELFCNELMLLPYYIASLNVEHAYYELAGEYAPFEGVCFVDTLGLVKSEQLPLFGEENTERVKREQDAEITVIIGNPPYNVGQKSENEANKNRRYLKDGEVDDRIRKTYAKDSKAKLNTKLYDPYVKFFRWATDPLQGRDGVVCFISNDSFVHKHSFDGMRKHLGQDFTTIYHLDLHGDVRDNPKLSGTTHNVFGIQVGVGITLLVRHRSSLPTGEGQGVRESSIYYHRVPEDWRRDEKLAYLAARQGTDGIEWKRLTPDAKHAWLAEGMQADFASLLPMGTKEAKAAHSVEVQTIFKTYSLGVNTARDDVAYDFDQQALASRVEQFIEDYNGEVSRWSRAKAPKDVDSFVRYDKIKWSRNLKRDLQRGKYAEFDPKNIRPSLYRPFTKMFLYFADIVVDERGTVGTFFPATSRAAKNMAVMVGGYGRKAFSVLLSDRIPNLNFYADPAYCFPLYTYDEDGSNRRENITEWALAQFRAQYGEHVSKRDIFHYVYAMLHHPHYRARYVENLKRELPRIPFVGAGLAPAQPGQPQGLPPQTFQTFVSVGARLADLHLNYERAKEHSLQWIENKDVPFSWRVHKMKLTADKMAIVVNDSLTLTGIPPETFAYRLGNRSALDWVVDQYQVSTDKHSGITSDPNRADDPEYIVRLIGRVIALSLATVTAVHELESISLAT